MTRLLVTSDLGELRIAEDWETRLQSVLSDAGFESELWDPAGDGVVPDARGLLVNSPHIGAAELGRMPHLEALVRFGSGIDNIDLDECERRGVVVRNVPGPIATEMAGAVVALVLERLFDLRAKAEEFAMAGWVSRADVRAVGLAGARVGLVGAGRIASRVSEVLRLLGARVCYASPSGIGGGFAGERMELDELCRTADVIVVLSPLRDDTRSLIGADRIAEMRPETHLIAISRGGVVDQRAAVEALRQGRLASLHLDVFDREPVDPTDLVDVAGLSLTPHNAAWTAAFFTETLREAARILHEVLRRPRRY